MTDSAAENVASMQDVLLKSQQEFFKNWFSAVENMQRSVVDPDWLAKFQPGRGVSDVYGAWRQAFSKYVEAVSAVVPGGAGMQTADRLYAGSDAYMRLYEFWKPLSSAVCEKMFDPTSYRSLMDPAKYRELVDKLFGFSTPEATAEMFRSMSGLFELWSAHARQDVQPWVDAVQRNADAWPKIMSGDTDTSLKVFRDFYSAFDKTVRNVLHVPAIGKDRENIQLVSKAIDRHAVFFAKSVEFQHKVYGVAQKAMEQVVAALADKVRKGEPVSGFEEFLKLWISINEKAFLELFRTEEYSKLQGLLLDAALEARASMHELMERHLREFPIVLRSEMNDVYKTNYELTRSVRALKRKVAELEAQLAARAKPTARRAKQKKDIR
jgi:hypothetical protein